MSAAKALAASGVNPSTSQQIQALLGQRQQTVLVYMGQLQNVFGPARYTLLDAFARRIVKFGTGAAIPVGFVPKRPAAGK